MRAKILLILLLIALAVGALAKAFIFDLVSVQNDDMAPALMPGDLLLADRLHAPPRRGQLVAFERPGSGHLLVRRVVGLPQESFELRDQSPWINGQPARRHLLASTTLANGQGSSEPAGGRPMQLIWEQIGDVGCQVLADPSRRSRDVPPINLGQRYYVLSDNRNHGADSREFGPIPIEAIRAVVIYRVVAGKSAVQPSTERENIEKIP